ncbi:hypothetical protein BFP72_06970 [Reichenbachiella sp. 5M10]|uniref:exo-beta-N-acetylmuramidase NamZ family protein n=1 Tax=Reichenbachiella sp. 5M10 TaxID=1889772 RepID=UPI000C154854|nr:DUF1343 domain-containing protein [Reichenbachiella sp. 5M10]PIB35156.1 hypothetical protein BFP72_06970 [Reichenbachiella sp. 5M10]
MKKYYLISMILIFGLHLYACTSPRPAQNELITGAENLPAYLPLLQDKKVGLLVNHTSYIHQTHLLDTLLALGVNVQTIFAPEHGFRGDMANGETVVDGRDEKTGIPVVSLYGEHKKPTKAQLKTLDVIVYDIQDVGARFYTYISSMHYMMEACAEHSVSFVLLDRPNPNGHYVDGPVLKPGFESFVGMHPIPIVYGMTAGELAQMILGEGWLKTSQQLQIDIIAVQNWDHEQIYPIPIAPSPNLPNDHAINLYPSLCLFEGTKVSVGRGTDYPFQVYGYPGDSSIGSFQFEPVSKPGYSKYPKHEGQTCYGKDLRALPRLSQLDLVFLLEMYQSSPDDFFNSFFSKLAGTDVLQRQIESGMTASEIRRTWQADLNQFNTMRSQYLIYP